MYESGRGKGQMVAMIHLFGIKYAAEIDVCGATPTELCRMAGLREAYGTEVAKGRRLASFVQLTPRAARL